MSADVTVAAGWSGGCRIRRGIGGQMMFEDASFFPVDLHVPERRFGFLRLHETVLERSTFLDNRIEAPLDQAEWAPLDVIEAAIPRCATPPMWLLHTSFCCSTLLARALHLPPSSVALKEPLILRRLADAHRAGWPIAPFVSPTVSLLARPWHAEGRVVIKPTHVALNIAAELIEASSGSRALAVSTGLEAFLVSNLKKPLATQQKIPELAQRALEASGLGARLPADGMQPPDLWAVAALQWCAQRETLAAIRTRVGAARFRFIDADALVEDLQGRIAEASAWFGLHPTEARLRSRVEAVATVHAKSPAEVYDWSDRRREAAYLRGKHAEDLRRTMAWAERLVFPAMSASAWTLERSALGAGGGLAGASA